MANRKNNADFVIAGKAQEAAAAANMVPQPIVPNAAVIASLKAEAEAEAEARREAIKAGPPVMQVDVIAARDGAIKGAVEGVMSSKAYAAARDAYFNHADRPWFGCNVPWYDVTAKDTGPLSVLLCKAVNFEDAEYKTGLIAAFKVAGNADYKGAKMRVSRVKQDAREAAEAAQFEAIREAAAAAGLTPPEPPKPEAKAVRSFKVRVADEVIKLYKAGRTADTATGELALDERGEEIYAALQEFMTKIGIDPKLVK
ncbi:hypothetical protein UFOVP1288_76 [uncultured Caudovirales phage]|uniref:Uncharacterized protein n=1 Tax=uncultured Caudovirales phage TaxID=2100421 RepID=A0A6J5S921_9CAUD|nr:hypothetical protein UFOVP1195_76 [uncultured Caudovirales phage]CAB4196313.1 hypothetical protein UFOVP1288_76 [uncultured Caudovirales phage]CAB4205223.1 hypothetical protein UFOVP1409_76 [uncultured Caudovirales phage]